MAEVVVRIPDTFETAVLAAGCDSITKWNEPTQLYGCGICGCIFLGNVERCVDGGEVNPDRFEMADGCDKYECKCHTLPRTMDYSGHDLTN